MTYPKYLFSYFCMEGLSFMDKEKKWMLMTYYCPTHGDLDIVKPIEVTKKEISDTFLKKDRSSKN